MVDDIMVHTIRITFGSQTQPQIEVQQGDYNSRTIQALCYSSSGVMMSFDGKTVSVVYEIAGTPSDEYPVAVSGNMLTFTMPGISASAAGSGKFQLRIYGAESLLHSAVIPYTVKASLEPGQGQEDQVPLLVMLVQQAQDAISGANAAADAGNQAAASANDAANLASEKAGLAQNAATNANQVADEIQQKAYSGAFNGKDGLNAPQIDDTQITTANPWSSKQIIDTLCPPLEVSGNPVVCYPVANYPLGVTVSWEPRQEGEGDPSPENVRPITGLDEVTVTLSDGVSDGTTHTLTMPETIYGGELDAVAGEGEKTWEFVGFDGTENWTKDGSATGHDINVFSLTIEDAEMRLQTSICNQFKNVNYSWGDNTPWVYSDHSRFKNKYFCVPNGEFPDVDSWQSYLAAQYAAGTPVTIAYKLATPQPIQATGGQSLPALPSTNTIYTDADSLTVTGRADPIATITALQNRVSALESAQTNM